MRTTISVIVETLSGATRGIEKLLALFDAFDIRTSFFLSLGPDRNAAFLKRRRSSGYLETCADHFQAIRQSSHDLGIAPWDPGRWSRKAAHADAARTRNQWDRALEAWYGLFPDAPAGHAATDFQANPWLFELEEDEELAFAST